jgi:hypothetical protein
VTVTVTGLSSGSGWFTPKSFITISVAHVRSTLRVTTSFTGCPFFTVTRSGTKPSFVTVTFTTWAFFEAVDVAVATRASGPAAAAA